MSILINSTTTLETSPDSEPAPEFGVIPQIRTAYRLENALAASVGTVIGGIVPIGVYTASHYGLDASRPWYTQVLSLFVAGGLIYSAKTVYQWGLRAFKGDAVKALGFVALVEGLMTFAPSNLWALSLTMLALLVFVNGAATACALSLDSRANPGKVRKPRARKAAPSGQPESYRLLTRTEAGKAIEIEMVSSRYPRKE